MAQVFRSRASRQARLQAHGGQRGPTVLAVMAVLSVVATSASAGENPSARLVYSRGPEAETCPDEAAVRAAVAARLGYDPFFPWAPTTVVVGVARAGPRFRAEVRLVDERGLERGVRHLESKGSECVDLMAAMALTISLAVDPLSLAPPKPAPEAEASKSEAAAEPAPSPARPEPEAAPPPPALPFPPPPGPAIPVQGYVGLGVLGSLGTAPAPSFGGDVFFGVARRAISVEIDARAELPATSDRAATSVRSERLMGSLVPCLHLGVGLLCAVGSLAWVHASGSASASPDGAAIAGALGARAGVEIAASSALRLRVYADLLGELSPPHLQNGPDVYTFPPVSADMGLAAVVRLFP